MMPRVAGRAISEKNTDSTTAATPPYAIDFRKPKGKKVMPARATATVMPETTTVRPAVATVRASASSPAYPRSSSSR